MKIESILNAQEITELAKERFKEERATDHLEGWFLAKEIMRECDEKFKEDIDSIRISKTLVEIANESATTDSPWIRQPLPLYFVPCVFVSLVSTPVFIPSIRVERNGTCKIEIASEAALAHSTIWSTYSSRFS
jgi:hypothetical protein